MGSIRGSSFYTLTEGPTWFLAEARAVDLGGHLASINSEAEQNWLTQWAPNENLWIGLTDSEEEGKWRWVNGDQVTYTYWDPEAVAGFANNTAYTIEKSNGVYTEGEDYVLMYANSRLWNDGVGRHDHGIWLSKGIAEIPLSYFSVFDLTLTEGSSGSVTISRTGGTRSTQNLTLTSSNGTATAGSDYNTISTTVSFAAGETSKSVSISTINDSSVESAETFNLTLTASSSDTVPAQISDGAAIVTINDNDSATSSFIRGTSFYTIVNGYLGRGNFGGWDWAEENAVALGGHLATINDADENAFFASVLRNEIINKYSLVGIGPASDAKEEWRYNPLIGYSDFRSEGKWEWSNKSPASYTNWHPGEPNSTSSDSDYAIMYFFGNITDSRFIGTWDDTSGSSIGIAEIPLSYFSVSDLTVTEGSAGSVTITRTGGTRSTQNLTLTSSNGTATAGADYTTVSTTVSFAAGETSKTVSISTINDSAPESTESFNLTLTASSSDTVPAQISDGTAVVTINDDDPTSATSSYSLSPSSTTINEGSLVSTTITTTNVASGITLYWSAVGSGITTSDFSFGALSGSASIGSDGKATFSHVLANDLSTEGSETLNILLYSDSNRSNQIAATSVNVNDTSIAPATPTVAVSGNNTGVINTGTINNSGTINSGTINTNSGNTANTTTNTSNVTVGPTIINNITNNITNTTTNTTSVLSNTSYPTYNVNNTWANNLVTGAITGSAPTLAKNSFDYKFYNLGGGRYGVQEKGSSKIDEITGASSLKFADQTLTPANDVAATFNQVKGTDDVSGVVFRLYNAAFSRLPDAKGLENWINGNASGGMTYASSAQSFSESQEFKNRYGSNVTDTQFITTLYNNVLGRAPDAAGLSHYQSLLAGGRSRGALLLDFSESPENRVLFTQVTGLA